MPPISKKPAAIKSAMKRVLKAYDYDPTDKLSLQEKAFATLQMIPTWNASTAYRVIFDPKGEKLSDVKKLAYLKNSSPGIYEMKLLMAEVITGLKGDAAMFPKKGKPQLDRELNAEADAFVKAEEKAERKRELGSVDDVDSVLSSGRYDKESLIMELTAMAKASSDTTEKIKILNAIATIDNLKNVASTNSEEIVKYFLPLKCHSCSLHAQAILDGVIEADE